MQCRSTEIREISPVGFLDLALIVKRMIIFQLLISHIYKKSGAKSFI